MNINNNILWEVFYMLFVFNKDKLISYSISAFIIAIIFMFSTSLVPKSDTQLIQVSSNVANSIKNGNHENNINNQFKTTNNIK